MTHYNLALIGFGNVGQALVRLLLQKQAELQTRYGITFTVTTITTGSHGTAWNPNGIVPKEALEIAAQGGILDALSASPPPLTTLELIHSCGADVLFENSPVNYQTGQPARDHIRTALESGMHAITANKGPVVHAHQELTALAAQHGRKFYFESTVMDGAPIFSLFRSSLPAAQLQAFSGILNSTTNLILTRMEEGQSFDEAVAYAQSIGIAETDPSGDVDGWDAAIKTALLATVLMGMPVKPDEVQREGIRSITPARISEAKAQGKRWKLVCRAERTQDSVRATVQPQMVGPETSLYTIEGTTSIVQFESDVLGQLSIVGSDPGPHTTAYGLLADFVNAVTSGQ